MKGTYQAAFLRCATTLAFLTSAGFSISRTHHYNHTTIGQDWKISFHIYTVGFYALDQTQNYKKS
jgi:hypothetical protein